MGRSFVFCREQRCRAFPTSRLVSAKSYEASSLCVSRVHVRLRNVTLRFGSNMGPSDLTVPLCMDHYAIAMSISRVSYLLPPVLDDRRSCIFQWWYRSVAWANLPVQDSRGGVAVGSQWSCPRRLEWMRRSPLSGIGLRSST